MINVGYSYSNRERTYGSLNQSSDTTLALSLFNEEWIENDFSIGFEIPLNLGANTFFNRLRLSANLHLLNVQTRNNFNDPEKGIKKEFTNRRS